MTQRVIRILSPSYELPFQFRQDLLVISFLRQVDELVGISLQIIQLELRRMFHQSVSGGYRIIRLANAFAHLLEIPVGGKIDLRILHAGNQIVYELKLNAFNLPN